MMLELYTSHEKRIVKKQKEKEEGKNKAFGRAGKNSKYLASHFIKKMDPKRGLLCAFRETNHPDLANGCFQK